MSTYRRRSPAGSALRAASFALAGLLLAACVAAARPRPGPFIFVHGLQGEGAAETARSIGCNTLYLDLPLDAPDHLDEFRAQIAEAAAADLQVIVGLPTKLAATYPISARDPVYPDALRAWVQAVVGGLAGAPGIAAWATDHYLERDLSLTDADFRDFVLKRYGSLEGVNAQWGSELRPSDELTRAAADALDADEAYGVGRPSVDLAEYQRLAFHDVLALWAEAIRAVDTQTPLMTGCVSLYRSLSAIPDSYAIVQVHMPPDILEPDLMTHNVQAVAMARRGGRFEVIPWLRVPLPPSEAYTKSALCRWIMEAGLRGAVGVGLEDWGRMTDRDFVYSSTVHQVLAALQQGPFTGDPPRPPAAVLYQPYAAGHLFQGTPAWGYIGELNTNDVAEPACNYRLGTVFGGLDYLCLQDLADAPLDAYSVILMPSCLSLPPEVVSILRGYTEGGGVLFADLGAGLYQARSWNPADGPMAAQFGLVSALEPAERFGDFRVGETHPDLPSVQVGMEAHGTFVPGRPQSMSLGHQSRYTYEGPATAMKSYAFCGLSWFVSVGPGAVPLATQSVRFDADGRPHFLGLTVAPLGSGLSIFAPFPCWAYWPPQDALHAAVHGDLMARRARYRLVGPDFADPGIGMEASEEAVHLLSRGGQERAQVLAAVADHRVYLGATCTFDATARAQDGRRSGAVLLDVAMTPGGMAHCSAIPVRIRPEVGDAHARPLVYGPGLIALEVGGNGAQWGRPRRNLPESFHGGMPTHLRVTVDDGLYPVEPGSTHQITLQEGRESEDTENVTADHRGRLDFWVTVTGGRLSITPAAP